MTYSDLDRGKTVHTSAPGAPGVGSRPEQSDVAVPRRTVHDLPELPVKALAAGGVLGHSPVEPIITLLPRRAEVAERPTVPADDAAAHCAPAGSHYIRNFITQVTYPRVSVYPNSAPSAEVLARAIDESGASSDGDPRLLRGGIQSTRFFKLSEFEGRRFEDPRFATVHYGPWSAQVVETESCRTGCSPPPVHWKLNVNGFPGLELEWYGSWHDVPAQVHPTMGLFMNDLLQVGDTVRNCCPGFERQHPGGPCIPQSEIDITDHFLG